MGERAEVPPPVVEHGVHVGREHALVVVVGVHRRVGPPEEGLGVGQAVLHPHPHFQHGLVRAQGEAGGALHARDALDLAAPQGHGAVRVGLDGPLHRSVGAGPVVLGPVELDPAADPGAGQAHQGGLDHVVVVDEGIAVGLVQGHVDPAAQPGQHHHLQVAVLQEHRLVRLRPGLVEHLVDERQRVDRPRGALVDPLLQEHRVVVGRADAVGRQFDPLIPDPDRYIHEQLPGRSGARGGQSPGTARWCRLEGWLGRGSTWKA